MKNIVIIGNSAAGVAAIEGIRSRDRESKITVISDEAYLAYCRCLISNYLSGTVAEKDLTYRDAKFYKDNNVELLLEKKVERVDSKKKRIILEDKSQISYDSLIIATGSSPKIPKELKGVTKRGVFGFRTIKDTKEIITIASISHTSCVLGGGLIGLKAAYGLNKRKLDVKVIVKSGRILSQIADKTASELFLNCFQKNGIEVMLNTDISEIIGNGDLRAVKLDSGKAIGCSLVIVGKGVAPNIKLISETDIKTDKGILVDESMRTSVNDIYAAGDVAETFDLTADKYENNALWPCAVEQGRIAGLNIAGENIKYTGSLGMNSVDFFGLPLVSMGAFDTELEAASSLDREKNLYKKLVLKGSRLIGALLVGDIRNSGLYLRLIKEKADISKIKDDLLDANLSYAKIAELIKKKEEKIYL
ncbi:MAG: FAD-dependent oxidoreductase [Candidatus Omnitrophota bacterium]|nr:FAD-dependent oxidoreductase [Candidatus Omnitrophota bacterium]